MSEWKVSSALMSVAPPVYSVICDTDVGAYKAYQHSYLGYLCVIGNDAVFLR